MIIKSAVYLTSVVEKSKLLDEKPEFAFVGRSNVGKSSLINSLVNNKKLCKTSSMPGRTRMVNYFEINKDFYFVDLPGYGYAKAGLKNKILWSSLIEEYLVGSKKLKRVFILVDSRHEPSDLDVKMVKMLFFYQIPFTVIATKTDKLPKSKINSYIQKIAHKLMLGKDNIIPHSSMDHSNRNIILQVLEQDLEQE